MKKRNESSLVTSVLRYLQCLENIGSILHCDRLNSGKIIANTGERLYHLRLCRAGTADGFIILRSGSMAWFEAKTAKAVQTDAQRAFEAKVKGVGHYYWLIRCLDDMRSNLKSVGVNVH